MPATKVGPALLVETVPRDLDLRAKKYFRYLLHRIRKYSAFIELMETSCWYGRELLYY